MVNAIVYKMSTCFWKESFYGMLFYSMLWYGMECMVCYGIFMLCYMYEICMLCYSNPCACVWAAIWLDQNLNGCNFFIFQGNKLNKHFRMLTNILKKKNLYIMCTSAHVCTCIKFWFLCFCIDDIVIRCLACWWALFSVKWWIKNDS